jgi:hypothetical protein
MAIRKKSRLERLLSFNQHRKRKGASKAYQKINNIDFAKLKAKKINGDNVSYTYGSSKDINEH